MGLFRESDILMVVTGPRWSLMAVTASGHRPGIQLGSASIRGYLGGYFLAVFYQSWLQRVVESQKLFSSRQRQGFSRLATKCR